MNKKMKELLKAIDAKYAAAKAKLADGEEKDVEGADALIKEAQELEHEFELEKAIYESELNAVPSIAEQPSEKEEAEDENAKFCKAVRSFVAGKRLVEGTDADGGYTVPEDITTAVNHWAEVNPSLLNEIDVVSVSTNKGARTYQKKADADVFVDLDENGAITTEITAPQFERITYTIQDRAGFMPVSNDLIADSDANIMATVTDWLGRSNNATANAKILEIIGEHDEVDLKDIDGLQEAFIITLGQAYPGGKIITNDDGLLYLSTLKDTTGRPLLNPDPTAPQNLQLRMGATVKNVTVYPNKVLKTTDHKVPFICGDLKQGIRKWDRQSMSLKASDVATIGSFNAYAMNMTLLRAILRDDYTKLDDDAYVVGYITVGAQASSSDGGDTVGGH